MNYKDTQIGKEVFYSAQFKGLMILFLLGAVAFAGFEEIGLFGYLKQAIVALTMIGLSFLIVWAVKKSFFPITKAHILVLSVTLIGYFHNGLSEINNPNNSKKGRLEAQIKSEVDLFKKQIPKANPDGSITFGVDSEQSLIKIKIQIPESNQDKIDIKKLQSATEDVYRELCSKSRMKSLLEVGIDYSYAYYDSAKELIAEVRMSVICGQ